MKHESTRSVFDYWTERRGDRPAPERGEIDPAAIRHALGDTFMLAADFVDVLRFRLAGTRVCALFCREIKGEAFDAPWAEASRKSVGEVLHAVTGEAAGAVAGIIGRTADGSEADLELLLLPLAHTGHARIRAMGVLAPIVPPYWLGEKPVCELELRTLRHVGSEVDSILAPRFALHDGATHVRHGFVVYSGGREASAGEQTGS
jgi:hypothetical protein